MILKLVNHLRNHKIKVIISSIIQLVLCICHKAKFVKNTKRTTQQKTIIILYIKINEKKINNSK